MKRILGLTAVLFSYIFILTPIHAANFQVDPGSDSDCGDFNCDLHSAFDVADSNGQDDTIQIAEGQYDSSLGAFIYNSTENRSLEVFGAGPDLTVIDGGASSAGIVIFTNGALDSQVQVHVQGIRFQNGLSGSEAGGLSVESTDSSARVENCVFDFNETQISGSSVGGGGFLFNSDGAGSLVLFNNRFTNNLAADAFGGGSFAVSLSGDLMIQNNTYENNSVLDLNSPPAQANFGGGAIGVAVEGDITFDRNVFKGNSALTGGGVAAVAVFGSGSITNNLVVENSVNGSLSAGPVFGGGGAAAIAPFGSMTIVNNTIVGNSVIQGDAGGLVAVAAEDVASLTIANNIIWGNSAGGGTACPNSCDDLLLDDDGDRNNVGSEIEVVNNDFSDFHRTCDSGLGCAQNGLVDPITNVDLDPLFVNAGGGDYHLGAASPLIDKGTASVAGLTAVDLEGDFRVQGNAPDMGALESPFTALPPPGLTENCANNVDDDGDNAIDCLDPDCAGASGCQEPPPNPENCGNNLDDDGNGLTDCADPVCAGAVACPGEEGGAGGENCANNLDDDGDGQTDCADPNCEGAVACQPDDGGVTVDASGGCGLSPVSARPNSMFWVLPMLSIGLAVGLSRRGLRRRP